MYEITWYPTILQLTTVPNLYCVCISSGRTVFCGPPFEILFSDFRSNKEDLWINTAFSISVSSLRSVCSFFLSSLGDLMSVILALFDKSTPIFLWI